MIRPWLAVVAIAAAALTACGDHPVPARGPILRHDHSPEMWIMQQVCSGNPPTCVPIMNYIPESWSVTVQDMHNRDWTGTVGVDPVVYAECDRPKIWPDCWKNPRQ